MESPLRSTLNHAAFVGLLLAASTTSHLTAQTAARETPVEIDVPKPPTPVVVEGKTILAYELHITNFGAVPLRLREVAVSAPSVATSPSRDLLILRDSAVLRAMRTPMQAPGRVPLAPPDVIPPDGRAIIFVWIDATSSQIPHSLRHRLAFVAADSASQAGAESHIDSIDVRVQTDQPLVLAPPLPAGEWLAGNGPSNESEHRRSLIAFRGKARIAQRFASDWLMIGPNGNTWHDDRSKSESYWGFGQPVLAVADAQVVATVDSLPDNAPRTVPPITIANIAGNYIILKLADGVYAMYAHLKHGSLRVRAGERVKRGTTLAQLGNSGQTTGPHLHFHVMDGPSPLAAEGIPFELTAFHFEGLGQDYEPGHHPSLLRRRELPLGDAVVAFP